MVMFFSGVTNGEVCYQQWKIEEHHTGLHGEPYEAAMKAVDKLYPDDPKRHEYRNSPEASDAEPTKYHGLADAIGGGYQGLQDDLR